MKALLFKNAWNRVSRNGLYGHEGVHGHREVIFLNRILVISGISLLLFIPVEVIVNGWQVVPVELSILSLMMFGLYMQARRWFWAARIFAVVIGNGFIFTAALLVGKGINNHVAMIPIMLFGMLLFKKTTDRVIVLFIALSFYLGIRYFQEIIPALITIPPETHFTFTTIFQVFAMILTFFLGYYFIGINDEYENLITAQKEKIESHHKEITDSITYAERIQQAKLPSLEEISKHLSGSFVLFKPKAIVSGDFYFFREQSGHLILAAADCTGHGVPGALMSMIGSEKLSDVVSRTTRPSLILKELNKAVKESLRQRDHDSSTRDGMDIALCSFSPLLDEVQFAGANRPLWLIRNNAVTEVKGSRKAIGGFTEDEAEFENHTIQLEKGDCLYMFSDGYADQFNGSTGKKLMTRRFRELLLEVHNLPPGEQRTHLNSFIESWRDGTEQIDDILVIGIRV